MVSCAILLNASASGSPLDFSRHMLASLELNSQNSCRPHVFYFFNHSHQAELPALVASSELGLEIGPPGESWFLAVRISTPSSVTKRVCSGARQHAFVAIESTGAKLTKLRGTLAINSGAGPVVWPSDVAILAQCNHRFDGKCHSWLAFTNSLVLGIVGDVGRTMEKRVDAMATVGADDAAVLLLGMLLNDISKLADQDSRFDSLDGFFEAFACRFDNPYVFRIGFGLVADIVGLV